jgi:hypothetical protein
MMVTEGEKCTMGSRRSKMERTAVKRWKSIWKLFGMVITVLGMTTACSTLTMEVETQDGQSGVRTQMEATDPATVNLAAGQPQLVEFFAFW